MKLSTILQEIQIRPPKSLKDSIYELVNNEGGIYDLENLLNELKKDKLHYDDFADEDWESEGNNPHQMKEIFSMIKSNVDRIEIITLQEDDPEIYNIREYKDLIAWSEYPEGNIATAYLIFLK